MSSLTLQGSQRTRQAVTRRSAARRAGRAPASRSAGVLVWRIVSKEAGLSRRPPTCVQPNHVRRVLHPACRARRRHTDPHLRTTTHASHFVSQHSVWGESKSFQSFTKQAQHQEPKPARAEANNRETKIERGKNHSGARLSRYMREEARRKRESFEGQNESMESTWKEPGTNGNAV